MPRPSITLDYAARALGTSKPALRTFLKRNRLWTYRVKDGQHRPPHALCPQQWKWVKDHWDVKASPRKQQGRCPCGGMMEAQYRSHDAQTLALCRSCGRDPTVAKPEHVPIQVNPNRSLPAQARQARGRYHAMNHPDCITLEELAGALPVT